jgi:hypothetical protein
MRHQGYCHSCRQHRLLPGRTDSGDACCGDCAGITNLTCRRCGTEAEHYRKDTCARCVLDTELSQLLRLDEGADRPGTGEHTDLAMRRLRCGMVRADRPESLLAWLRAAPVRELLTGLATGQVPLTHEGLDALPASRGVEHMRALLEGHEVLAPRDHHLALFERWLDDKLSAIEDRRIRQPLEQFARWHHLNRLRRGSRPGQGSRGPVHAAKQQITEVAKFLTWLQTEHHRYIDGCAQLDVEDYLSQGPTTRHLIRTFFVWRAKNKLPPEIVIGHRQPRRQPVLTQDQRLAWVRRCLTHHDESRPYRVAGVLLLLYAQPLVRIAALAADSVRVTPEGPVIILADDPLPVPQPFAELVMEHVAHRPNLRTNNRTSPWLFPARAGDRHLHPDGIMKRLRGLGIDLQAARTSALRGLVAQAPPPVVAQMLGYSYQITEHHAREAATTYSRYVAVPDRSDG